MSEPATLSHLAERLQQSKERIVAKDYSGALEILQPLKTALGEASLSEQEDFLYQMGVCLNGLEKPQEAVNFLSRSLRLAETSQDLSAQARNLEELGGAHHQRGDLRRAGFFYQAAQQAYQQLQDPAGTARGFRNLAGIRVDMGESVQAGRDFQQARQLFSELKDSEGVATCVTNLALMTYRSQGRAAAIVDYKQHVAQGDCDHFLVYNNLGFLQLMEEQLEEAGQNLRQGLQDCQKRGVVDDNLGLLHLNLGVIEGLEGRLDSSRNHLEQASLNFAQYPVGRAVLVLMLPPQAQSEHKLGRFLVAEDGHKLAVAFLNSAMLALLAQDQDEAQRLAQKAVELDPNQGYPLAILGWILKTTGDNQAAGHAFRKALSKEPGNAQLQQFLDCTNPYLRMNLGRNDICPCGSNKKFKKCHGAG